MTYVTTGVFQSYSTMVKEQLNILNLAVLGYDPNYPISLEDLGSDVTAYYDPAQFYKKGEPIASRDLPTVPTKTYVDSRTRGVTSLVTAPIAIDELVAAREGELTLVDNLANYSLKSDLITNINALTSGTINAVRIATIAHSSLSGLTDSGCHTQGAITNLTSDLAAKANKATIIAEVNASTEESSPGVSLLISKGKTQPHDHTDITNRNHSDAHDMASITGLTAAVADGQSAWSAISTALSGTTYATLDAMLDCIRQYLQNIDGVGLPNAPACWSILV